MKEKLKEKLEEYCRETLADNSFDKVRREDWAFGALTFSCYIGLIDKEELKDLTGRFDLAHW